MICLILNKNVIYLFIYFFFQIEYIRIRKVIIFSNRMSEIKEKAKNQVYHWLIHFQVRDDESPSSTWSIKRLDLAIHEEKNVQAMINEIKASGELISEYIEQEERFDITEIFTPEICAEILKRKELFKWEWRRRGNHDHWWLQEGTFDSVSFHRKQSGPVYAPFDDEEDD